MDDVRIISLKCLLQRIQHDPPRFRIRNLRMTNNLYSSSLDGEGDEGES